jgi:hypothetical protein
MSVMSVMSDVLQVSPIAIKKSFPHPSMVTIATQEENNEVFEDMIKVALINPSLEAIEFKNLISLLLSRHHLIYSHMP